MKNNRALLWLDDLRNPFDTEANWTSVSPVPFDEIRWCKSYNEFCEYIKTEGLPYVICFDHDLGEEHSGKDCANFLVEYCLENNQSIPYFASQSSTPPGKDNILGLLEQAKGQLNQ